MMQAALSCAGPTVHNKRVRISTQLATNGLSQAVKGQGKTVTVATLPVQVKSMTRSL